MLSQLLESSLNANPVFIHIFVNSNHIQMYMLIQYNFGRFCKQNRESKSSFEFETDCIDLENFPINRQFYTKIQKL